MKRIFFLLFICINFYNCKQKAGCATALDEIVNYIIEKPIHNSITDLEGGGECWQGYSIFLKFKSDRDFINYLEENGFEETNWASISFWMELPTTYEYLFKSGWQPKKVQNKICFEKTVSNSWTGKGNHYFLMNKGNNTVYFYGVGM